MKWLGSWIESLPLWIGFLADSTWIRRRQRCNARTRPGVSAEKRLTSKTFGKRHRVKQPYWYTQLLYTHIIHITHIMIYSGSSFMWYMKGNIHQRENLWNFEWFFGNGKELVVSFMATNKNRTAARMRGSMLSSKLSKRGGLVWWKFEGCFRKWWEESPQIIPFVHRGFPFLYTIHFGGFPPIFGNIHLFEGLPVINALDFYGYLIGGGMVRDLPTKSLRDGKLPWDFLMVGNSSHWISGSQSMQSCWATFLHSLQNPMRRSNAQLLQSLEDLLRWTSLTEWCLKCGYIAV